jgi:hypothetical protein
MILNLLRIGFHVQRKTTSVETLEGTLAAGPGRWRMESGTPGSTPKAFTSGFDRSAIQIKQ